MISPISLLSMNKLSIPPVNFKNPPFLLSVLIVRLPAIRSAVSVPLIPPRAMAGYRRMTYTDRLMIEKLYNAGNSYRAIARITGFHPSSVYREVQRGMYQHFIGKHYIYVPRYSATIL